MICPSRTSTTVPSCDLLDPQPEPRRALDQHERLAGGGEQQHAASVGDEQRARGALGQRHAAGLVVVQQGRGGRAAHALEGHAEIAVVVGEHHDRLGVDGDERRRARHPVLREQLVVVVEVAVVDADYPPVADGVVVVVDPRDALRELAHVHDRGAGVLRHHDLVDQVAQPARVLGHFDVPTGAVVRDPGGVLPALTYPREKQACGCGQVEVDSFCDAHSGDPAHTFRQPPGALVM